MACIALTERRGEEGKPGPSSKVTPGWRGAQEIGCRDDFPVVCMLNNIQSRIVHLLRDGIDIYSY